jgi:polyhydroxybutyrate depolymerase
MKQFHHLLLVLLLPVLCFAQQTIEGSITHDDIQRDYILYIPASYSGEEPVPLIFNFHGYGSNAEEQMWYGDFRAIADTAGFVIVHPEGTLFEGFTHWNVGGWTVGSPADDVGFTSALIDSLSTAYNIDPLRVYATGMSNGGYMSFLLACQLGERIAAIASVTGAMTPETYNECGPQHPTPILQAHGTTDSVVPYNGTIWSESIDDVIQYWVDYNNCNIIPTIIPLPDIDPDDGSTVEHIIYDDGDNGVVVEHFRVIGGGHTWPGSAFGGPGTNYDIDASVEIWTFFSRYDINGSIDTEGVITVAEELPAGFELVQNHPNPFNPSTTIEYRLATPGQVSLSVYNIKGQLVDVIQSGYHPAGKYSVEWAPVDLPGGVYFVEMKAVEFHKVLKVSFVK